MTKTHTPKQAAEIAVAERQDVISFHDYAPYKWDLTARFADFKRGGWTGPAIDDEPKSSDWKDYEGSGRRDNMWNAITTDRWKQYWRECKAHPQMRGCCLFHFACWKDSKKPAGNREVPRDLFPAERGFWDWAGK